VKSFTARFNIVGESTLSEPSLALS
jgi:hypothetical protein